MKISETFEFTMNKEKYKGHVVSIDSEDRWTIQFDMPGHLLDKKCMGMKYETNNPIN